MGIRCLNYIIFIDWRAICWGEEIFNQLRLAISGPMLGGTWAAFCQLAVVARDDAVTPSEKVRLRKVRAVWVWLKDFSLEKQISRIKDGSIMISINWSWKWSGSSQKHSIWSVSADLATLQCMEFPSQNRRIYVRAVFKCSSYMANCWSYPPVSWEHDIEHKMSQVHRRIRQLFSKWCWTFANSAAAEKSRVSFTSKSHCRTWLFCYHMQPMTVGSVKQSSIVE